MHKFGLSIQDSQFHLFLFLASVAAGTLIGGPLGDRLEEYIIWISILGAAPFTLLLPYADLFWCSVSNYWDSYCFGFSAILVLLKN
jgi:FSR family fosmidomycin resistance protein-like MFS transporter